MCSLNIAVLGTGPVGRAVAARLSVLGHTVTIGTRINLALGGNDFNVKVVRGPSLRG